MFERDFPRHHRWLEVAMRELWNPKLQSWLQGHAGIVSVAQLARFGCPARDAYRLAASDEFELIMPGVLRSRHWPAGAEQLMIAACVRNQNAVIALLTSAKEWNFRGLPMDDQVHVLVPSTCSPDLPGVVVHRCRRIDDVDIVRRRDGTRITSPTRTLFDCADLLGRAKTESILEQLINEGKGTFVTHASTLARLGRRGRPGTRTMVAVIAARPAWRVALQSELELRVLNEIGRQGLPMPTVQSRCDLSTGRHVRFDFAWAEMKVALEVDHPFWHSGAKESDRDNRRDLKMATVGWQTLRITDLDVHGGLSTAIRDVAAVLARR